MINPEEIEFVSSYIEDGELNVLAELRTSPRGRYARWMLTADPKTKELKEVHHFISTNDGFEYPEFTPTKAMLRRFRALVGER